jgi:hypothetical protein
VYVDPDGKDFNAAWENLKVAIENSVSRVSVGAGLQLRGRIGRLSGNLGLSALANVKFASGKLSLSVSMGIGAEGQLPGGAKFGEAIAAERTFASLDVQTGRLSGRPNDDFSRTDSLGILGGSIDSDSDGNTGIGMLAGEGVVQGGELGVNPTGAKALSDAMSEVHEVLFPEPPPMPTPPPVPVQLLPDRCSSGEAGRCQ